MKADSSRSEQVVDDFKKRKVAASALRRIHEIIDGFERERSADFRLARIGIVLVVAILAAAAWFYFNTDTVTLP